MPNSTLACFQSDRNFCRNLTAATLTIAALLTSALLTGCGLGAAAPATASSDIIAPAMSGKTYGGPNPIIGATIKVYTTGNSDGTNGGYGVATFRQEATTVNNGANYPSGDTTTSGFFSFAGGYTCPAGQFAYIVSSGGNTGASGSATGATATSAITAGAVTGITVTAAGSGYLSATVTITPSDGNPPTTPATATAVISNGTVSAINVTASGGGYTAAPTVTISAPTYTNAANNNAVLVAALGRCEDLYANTTGGSYTGTPIYINELSTIAAAYALGHFSTVTGTGASTVVSIGADTTNNAPSGSSCVANGTTCATTQTSGLLHAFKNAANLANVFNFSYSANSTSTSYPGQASATIPQVPQQLLNTIGNVLVACVNSIGGTAGDGSACGKIFSYTTLPASIAAIDTYTTTIPTNTFGAMVNLAANPTLGGSGSQVTALQSVAGAFTSVYTPNFNAATLSDFSVGILYPTGIGSSTSTGIKYPYAGALDINDVYYMGNAAGSGTAPVNVYSFSSNGTFLGSSATNSSFKFTFGLSVDGLGNGYFGDASGSGNTALGAFTTSGGVASSITTLSVITSAQGTQGTGGLLKVYATAVDKANNLWVYGASASGTAPASTTYLYNCGSSVTTATLCTPEDGSAGAASSSGALLAIDPNQNVWSGSTASLAVLENTGTVASPTYTYTAGGTVPAADTATTGPNPLLGLAFTGTASDPAVWVSGYKTGTAGLQPITYTQNGAGVGVASITAGTTEFTSTLTGPYGAEGDGLGIVWMANYNNADLGQTTPTYSTPTAYRLGPCMGVYPQIATCTAMGKPTQVSIDSAGSMWVPVPAGPYVVEIIGTAAPTWPLLSLGLMGQP